MAVSKKYAGLPDLDAAPEIYETPELTDDASTVQTGTLRTESPTQSDEDGTSDERLDRQRLNRDEARRRFEPAVVDAREVNFSDTIGEVRKSYKTRSRRRRRRRSDGGEEYGDISDSEEESLPMKIARLRREAEEVRIELAKREKGTEDEDHLEDKKGQQQNEDGDINEGGIEELNKVLNGLYVQNSVRHGSSQGDLTKQLARGPSIQSKPTALNGSEKETPSTTSEPPISSISAIGVFADRLTAIESALGISTIDPSDQSNSILSNLNFLSGQINTLSSTLAPTKTLSNSSNITSKTSLASSPIPNLDTISKRIRSLVLDAEKLTESRKAALQSLNDLHEARLRQTSTTPYVRPQNVRSGSSTAIQPINRDEQDSISNNNNEDLKLQSQLFLDEQANKITALYQVLPTIQNLQPLLPVVLDRLRALSVVHAGASEAKAGLDDIEKKQVEMEVEIMKWKDAVDTVENSMKEFGQSVKSNVETVGELVNGLEKRVEKLKINQ